MAALWPERSRALVSVSGYLIGEPAINRRPLPPAAELAWWYQFYFATERGKGWVRPAPRRVRQAHLANRIAASGTSTRRRSHAARHPSTIPITSTSSSTTTGGGSGSADGERRYDDARTPTRRGARRSRCRPSRSRATPMERRIPTRRPTRAVRRDRTSIGSSPAASATTCRRRRRERSPTRLSTLDHAATRTIVARQEALHVGPDKARPHPLVAHRLGGRSDELPVEGRLALVRRRDRLAQLRTADAGGPAGPRRARRLLDLHLRQLAADAAVRARVGREVRGRRAHDRRRPHARVRLRARPSTT